MTGDGVRSVRYCCTYHVLVNALVELPLSRAALPELLVAVVEAFPVLAELSEAVCVDVLDARSVSVTTQNDSHWSNWRRNKSRHACLAEKACSNVNIYVHARGAASDTTALLQAIHLAVAWLLGLALHVVIVVVAASGADEERRRQERSRASTDFLDRGDILGQRSGVDESLLVESANKVNRGQLFAQQSDRAAGPNCAHDREKSILQLTANDG